MQINIGTYYIYNYDITTEQKPQRSIKSLMSFVSV